ncbi:MAG: DedA family protein [Alphaproteobacteria bacterium]|jgi:membrane protein YqaA with SNARE-associated domain|nr:DedA family protein [Alphaproteobacteria bacterium]
MLRSWYDWVIRMSEHPKALWTLAGVSFAESSFFPIPPDLMLIPMVIAQRAKAWLIAGVCTIASVVGGFFGYAIGFFLLETVGKWLLEFYGMSGGIAEFQEWYAKWGLWVILIKGATPIPYKLVTIASGAAHFDLLVFGLASLATRGARFFLVAALLYVYGEPIRGFIEKHLTLVTTAFVAVILAGFVAIRFL